MPEKTINFTLRLPPTLDTLLAEQAAREGLTKSALIIQTLWETQAPGDLDPGLVLGFVELVGGELDEGVDCPECGLTMWHPHVGFVAGGRRPLAFGPVCGRCARTD